ncbi:MAG: peptidoglycan-binding protein [Christensenellaceae bacterium]|nr:peptidoglycan-binding protein [Christensenellaceae bacterium]MEA5067771.1 peptidoglycan-binding protein [Christensenellaceae bacterium]
MKKIVSWTLFILAMAALLLLGGCSNTPDKVEDPLSAFGIDEVLPFPTVSPEPTATPAPTADVDNLPTTDVGQGWKADNTVSGETSIDTTDEDVFATPAPTARPRQTPRPNAQDGYERLSSDYEQLSSGDSGGAVRDLQNRLKALGYYTGTVDSKYGSGTTSAVKRFQSIMGYSETGVATPSLQEALFNKNAPRYEAPLRTPSPTKKPDPAPQYEQLSRGDTGSRVTRLQNRLRTLGYFSGKSDGDYGSATVTAVKHFQKALRLEQTGVATVALQKKLFSSSAPYYEAAPTPAPDGYEKLSKGSSGATVKKLQARLKALGYFGGTADGKFANSTVNAVKLFQRAVGEKESGVASAALQKKLYSKTAPFYEGDDPEEPDEYPVLSPGDTGAAVKKLQKRLKELGYFDGDIGGNYLAKTTEAVKRFQKAINVKETGTATTALQKKLFSSNAPKYKPDPKPDPDYVEISEGDTGAHVKRMQQRLADLGYYGGSVNGNFGPRTSDAVKQFEARYGKPKTGIASPALQKKLFSDDALPAEGEPEPEPGADYVKLKPGDSGTQVKKLQKRLKALGYFEGSIGGNYKKLTTDAVKRFQKALGFKQDGVATVELQMELFSDSAPVYEKSSSAPEPGSQSLKRGDTGDAVKALQNRLIELGYIKNEGDVKLGTFDKNTMLAVIDAQNARGQDSDGIADEAFLTYIYSDDAWTYALAEYEGG